MNLLKILFLSAFLILSSPAYASEDGESYDENLDFSFDDVPDVELLSGNDEVSYDVRTNDNPVASDDNQTNENIFIPTRPEIVMPIQDTEKDTTDNQPITKGTTLTDQLKSSPSPDNDNILEGTWIKKLTELSPSKILGNKKSDDDDNDDDDDDDDNEGDENADLDNMMSNYRKKGKNGKSNASVFDIAGVMLRMHLNQAEDILTNRGFKKINARMQIPNFIKWRNEETCRNSGTVGYERTQACVIQKAKKDGFEYVQYIKYAKFETKEEIEIYLTSNFTDNKIYKIEYRSAITNINGNSPKAIYIRNLKVYDFWRRINRKYGVPDDKNMVTWGLGGNKPSLKASTGWLLLEDPMFVEMDYTRMSREDQRFIHSDFYNF